MISHLKEAPCTIYDADTDSLNVYSLEDCMQVLYYNS